MKMLYRLLKNYWEFQDGSSREVTKRGPLWVSGCLSVWLFECGPLSVWPSECLALWVSASLSVWPHECEAPWVWPCGCQLAGHTCNQPSCECLCLTCVEMSDCFLTVNHRQISRKASVPVCARSHVKGARGHGTGELVPSPLCPGTPSLLRSSPPG